MKAFRGLAEFSIAAIAIALIVAGAVAVFAVKNGAGSASLVVAGTALLALVMLRERIETLRWGDLELTLRRQADIAAAEGDQELELELRMTAASLARRASAVAGTYDALRSSMPPSAARTVALEEQVRRAREEARHGDFDREGLEELLRAGTDGERIYAIVVLQEHPDLATAAPLLAALREPRSRFEHYHTLRLAEEAYRTLSSEERQELETLLTDQLASGALPRDGHRARVASRIIEGIQQT